VLKKKTIEGLAARGLFALSALLWVGCARPAYHPGRLALKLPPDALGTSVSLQQHLRVEREGRVDELDVVLEVDSQRLDLIALALGQRVLSLHYDGRTLQSWRNPMLPPQLRDEDILEDVQLTFWPADAIQRALPTGWHIEEKGLQRTLSLDNKPVMVIVYSGEPHWTGKIELVNLRYNYRLTIESVSNDS